MNRKPIIKISYPEASEKAMQLTEAMVKRAPGRRVVETESEEAGSPAGGELFSGFIRCKTQTCVELTLTLNPSSMDYALETLIKPNLTADERKRILHEDSASSDDMFSAQAAADARTCTEEVRSTSCADAEREAGTQSVEQEKLIEVGKITEKALRNIIGDAIEKAGMGHGTFDAINTAIFQINKHTERGLRGPFEEESGLIDSLAVLIAGAQRVQPKRTTELRLFASDLALYLHEGIDDEAAYIVESRALEKILEAVQQDLAEHPGRTLKAELEELQKKRAMADPSWDDVEKEAREIGKNKADKTDKTDDIEPGLLDDLDDESKHDGDEAWMSHKCGDCRNFNGKNKCNNSGATVDKSCICGQWHDFGICETCAHFEHNKKKCQEVNGKPTLAMQSICPLHIDDLSIKHGSKTEADHG